MENMILAVSRGTIYWEQKLSTILYRLIYMIDRGSRLIDNKVEKHVGILGKVVEYLIRQLINIIKWF